MPVPSPSVTDDDYSPSRKDGMGHKCGVFGVFGRPDAAILAAIALHALQHRGEEACGIATYDRRRRSFHLERHHGLVGDAFGEDRPTLSRLPGDAAIGHNRYSTSGGAAARNIQPLFADLPLGGFMIAHNGNLTNARAIHRRLVSRGALFQTTVDTEVVLHLIAHSTREGVVERFIDALRQIDGGYAFVALTDGMLIGARDPVGLRPLVLGEIDGAPVLASETCAIEAIGGSYIRDIENGEVVVITENGVQSLTPFPARPAQPCVFEYVYFARPDSVLHGRSVYEVRQRFGRELAFEHGVEADLVVPVPDGGVPAALGFAEASGQRFGYGIIRNHYIGRTFIQPTQSGRKKFVSRKHAANRAILDGKRVVLVDDSIVRGTTSERIVDMVREAGAREVHFRVACPPIRHPDFYGIDMPDTDDLVSSRLSVEELRVRLKVDTLGFLSIDRFYKALCAGPRNAAAPQFADHCFTGAYPTELIDRDHDMSRKEHQLSLLDD